MVKKIWMVCLLFCAVLMLDGCSGSNTPSGIAEKSVSCMQKGEYKGYVDLVYFKGMENPKNKRDLESLVSEKGSKTIEKKGGIKSFKVLSEQVSEDGLSAMVSMNIVYGNGDEQKENMKMIKKDDQWMIDMNK